MGELSRTFLEFELQVEGIEEEAITYVSDLINNIQVKVVELETNMVPEIWDQREVEVKNVVASMSTAVEQCDKLLGDTTQTCSELEEHVELLKV